VRFQPTDSSVLRTRRSPSSRRRGLPVRAFENSVVFLPGLRDEPEKGDGGGQGRERQMNSPRLTGEARSPSHILFLFG
jgi:hypothetical protein